MIANRACKQIVSGGRFVPDGKDSGLVVAWCTDGRLRAFDPSGAGGETLEVPPGPLTALAISPDGRFLGFGFGDGKVVIQDRQSQRQTELQLAASPVKVRRLVFSDAGKIAIEHEKGLRLLTVPAEGGKVAAGDRDDLIDRPSNHWPSRPAASTWRPPPRGSVRYGVWRLGGDAPPAKLIDEPRAGASRLGFTGNSRALISGDFGGGVALRPSDPRAGDLVRWSFPAHDGKIQEISAAPGHRFLLMLDRKGSFRQARMWDLKDRTCRQVRGTWSSGLFLDDNRLALLADSAANEHLAGRLVLVDRERLSFNSAFFAHGSGDFQVPDSLALERLAASPDGKWLAAAADSSKVPSGMRLGNRDR